MQNRPFAFKQNSTRLGSPRSTMQFSRWRFGIRNCDVTKNGHRIKASFLPTTLPPESTATDEDQQEEEEKRLGASLVPSIPIYCPLLQPGWTTRHGVTLPPQVRRLDSGGTAPELSILPAPTITAFTRLSRSTGNLQNPFLYWLDSGRILGEIEHGAKAPAVLDTVEKAPPNPVEKHDIDYHLKVLREALDVPIPYTGGIHAVRVEDLTIYYDGEEGTSASRVDLGNAKDAELVALAAACDPATFGVNKQDVLDETYRKAGKLDLSKFASRLDVVASGLIRAISPDMLLGQAVDADKTLQAELYKLNVYGPGSFFKGHKDTPRGENMIGSLVVVFPTAHTGGELTLEHGGTSWTFDSAAELAAAQGPALAYVAAGGDERLRVTLTYNLFLADRTADAPANRIVPAPERALEASLRALLADPLFLPGGFLAYGLGHQYPIPPPPEFEWTSDGAQVPLTRLGPILQLLKGGDARVRTVSERVGLVTRVKILYDTGEDDGQMGRDVLADDVLNTAHLDQEDLHEEIARNGVVLHRGAERLEELRATRDQDYEEAPVEDEHKVAIQWVTKITETNRVPSQYVAYGNEASIEHIYGNAALFVEVPAAGEGIRG
ncbi:hypothetical protein C8R46DRAFT_1137377 [Mycena filopes]|nr:hypothetical protein C8R46DRAFT_1137377 [Mycena filopes]